MEGGSHALLDRLRNSDYHPADRVDLCREPRGMVQPPRGTPTRRQHENGAEARRGRTPRNILNNLTGREGGIMNPLNQGKFGPFKTRNTKGSTMSAWFNNAPPLLLEESVKIAYDFLERAGEVD